MSLALRAYRAVWTVGLALRVPHWILVRRPEELAERLGECPRGGEPEPLWIHAASVGEMNAARVLVKVLRERTAARIAVSAMTRTGRKQAGALGADLAPFHAPLDSPGVVSRFLDRLRPRGLVLVETELWPNLLVELRRRSIPWAVASGRLTARGARRLGRVRGLVREVLASVAAVGARTPEDAARFIALGAPASAVRVTGDLKEDREIAPRVPPDYELPRWFAACTRPGEEQEVLDATRQLSHPRGELTLAPRHPERFDEVARMAARAGFPVRRWAQRHDPPEAEGWSVLLVDEMGVLEEAYRRSPFAFIGGSLEAFGGHSPLEAAACGRAVLFGPHTENCSDAAQLLEEAGGAVRVQSAAELHQRVEALLGDREQTERRGRAAHGAVASRQGAGERTLDLLIERGLLS